MITELFPVEFRRFTSLPLFGRIADDYASWLVEKGYTWRTSRYELARVVHLDPYFRRRGFREVEELTLRDFADCRRYFLKKILQSGGRVNALASFLQHKGLLKVEQPPVCTKPTDLLLSAFQDHLQAERGFASSTVDRCVKHSREFLDWLRYDQNSDALQSLGAQELESFIEKLSQRMGRVGLQKPIATLRSLLRFLVSKDRMAPGLEAQIDTPRVQRQDHPPRSLPWPTVIAFLNAIDQNTAVGKRDYAMFSLMATYGLRACEVVSLTLDDVHWQQRRLRVFQTKTRHYLDLPLTDQVGAALYSYLRQVVRKTPSRHIFLRVKPPLGVLKPTGVTEAFQFWAMKSELAIPYKGTYCLRHSYAMFLLRQGESLKTIGDMLGHRTIESTGVYLRLSADDLRSVALPVPRRRVATEVLP